MSGTISKVAVVLAGIIVLLATIAISINCFTTQYRGIDFFPDHSVYIGITIFLIYLGFVFLNTNNSYPKLAAKELLYFYLMMAIIAYASDAVQLTPFPSIDKYIVAMDQKLGVNMLSILRWTHAHKQFQHLLNLCYNSLPLQMSLIPLILIALGRFQLMRSYYFLMLFTSLIGFVFYYFFPTEAPASVFNSPLFTPDQVATGIKFKQIHAHIIPSTKEGGLIAMPSFHVIWAVFCTYLVKDWFIPCLILGVINCLLIASCVLLGWHYPSDVIMGLILASLAFISMRLIDNTHPSTHSNKII